MNNEEHCATLSTRLAESEVLVAQLRAELAQRHNEVRQLQAALASPTGGGKAKALADMRQQRDDLYDRLGFVRQALGVSADDHNRVSVALRSAVGELRGISVDPHDAPRRALIVAAALQAEADHLADVRSRFPYDPATAYLYGYADRWSARALTGEEGAGATPGAALRALADLLDAAPSE